MERIWNDMKALDMLEAKREERRKNKTHLTFDCFNAKVNKDRVVCEKGKKIGRNKDGTMYLLAVLKGTTSSICKECPDFEGE